MIKLAELRVDCLARPTFDLSSFNKFLEAHDLEWERSNGKAAEELIEVSGRVCYMSFGQGRQSKKSNSQYILHLIKQGHESVLEHVSWTFILSGISRAFSHQLVRHRVGFAYSQLSQQYHDESEAFFVAPPTIANNKKALEAWKNSITTSLTLYKKLVAEIDNDVSLQNISAKEKLRDLRSACRSILPNATETKIVITCNARAVRHFFSTRGALEGDWEMRAVACALFKEVKKDAPAAFQDFQIVKMGDGSEKLVQFEPD